MPAFLDEVKSAKEAGLRYVIPKGKGIQRKASGTGFQYLDANDDPIQDEETLTRIRSLVIPPAWTSVWISPRPNTHIQAVGRDAKGRKQYRYHPNYRKVRDLVKFDRMRSFGRILPRIRRAVERDLSRPEMPKRKILAAVVKLLELSYIRIGNEEYAEENGSFGLTTLQNRHVQVLGDTLKFKFRGKSAQHHEITVKDPRLARIIRKCRDLPGSSLFEYLDEDGKPATIESGDVNDYLREISGGEFTAKDFRTWGGTCLAANCLLARVAEKADSPVTKSVLIEVVKEVAGKLGNKPATCKKYYIHPAILDSFTAGTLHELADKLRDSNSNYAYERIVLSLLTPLKRSRAKATGGAKAA
ncbi:MAG TPA: DNA topoisomerase IB [Bryobacteraceae bacterium]|nr:DNA topoisomerase IB [Bryobacteraceae bacterium]